jgi:hypothetical protein
MTLKEKTRPSQRTTPTSTEIGQWLLLAAILVAVALLAIRVMDVVSDNEALPVVPAAPAAEPSGSEWTLDDESAAIQSHGRAFQGAAKAPASDWTLKDEFAAIHNHARAEGAVQTERPSEPVTSQTGPR